jgi:hypothetical protein
MKTLHIVANVKFLPHIFETAEAVGRRPDSATDSASGIGSLARRISAGSFVLQRSTIVRSGNTDRWVAVRVGR